MPEPKAVAAPAPPLREDRSPLRPHAIRVLKRRYLRRDDEGRLVETPDEMFWRVARAVAEADRSLPYGGRCEPERTARRFHRMTSSLEFLPNSPTLMNAGREQQQLCACFVLPVEDSIEGIFATLKNTALIHKTGGGTGFSFSRLRPRNSRVRTTSGVASGPVSFMKVFNAATEAIKQGGARRGANMGMLRVDHPDILEFIDCKRDPGEVTNFNISVAITEDFMRAHREDRDYRLVDPRDGAAVGALPAREVLNRIAENAWSCGDPGVVFIDRINASNPTRHVTEIEATNPCGEQPLAANEACTLGSVNLGLMVSGDEVDYTKLSRTIRAAVHFLDNVIEVTRYPVPEIEETTKANRRIGVGVMGWADMLILLGIPYDSEEAVRLAEQVMAFIDREARSASAGLAGDRGAFPSFEGSLHQARGTAPLRNATTTTVAPTGTISIIAGASSGIEPLYAVSYARKHVLGDDQLEETHPIFQKLAAERGLLDPALLARIHESGSLRGFRNDEIDPDLKRLFVTAHDLSPEWHVKMQAAFQRHCDNAVSKTVNLPESATPRDVREVFLNAYALGCKGVTVYRDRSRARQVLNTGRGSSEANASTLDRFFQAESRLSLDELGRTLQRRAREDDCGSDGSPSGPESCPDCGSDTRREAGCNVCQFCGFSTCL